MHKSALPTHQYLGQNISIQKVMKWLNSHFLHCSVFNLFYDHLSWSLFTALFTTVQLLCWSSHNFKPSAPNSKVNKVRKTRQILLWESFLTILLCWWPASPLCYAMCASRRKKADISPKCTKYEVHSGVKITKKGSKSLFLKNANLPMNKMAQNAHFWSPWSYETFFVRCVPLCKVHKVVVG